MKVGSEVLNIERAGVIREEGALGAVLGNQVE